MSTLISAPQMTDRVGGVVFFAYEIQKLGVMPAGSTSSGPGWTEEQFRVICDKVIARLEAAKKKSEDDEL